MTKDGGKIKRTHCLEGKKKKSGVRKGSTEEKTWWADIRKQSLWVKAESLGLKTLRFQDEENTLGKIFNDINFFNTRVDLE